MSAFLGILFLCFAVALMVPIVIYLIVPIIKGVIWLIAHVLKFIAGMLGDSLRLIGATLTAILIVPMTVGAVVLGRWSTSAHFGRALKGEVVTVGRCCYRIAIGHPARLLGLTPLTEGVERRIPEVLAAAPGRDAPSRRTGQFDGYTIVGSLPGGGSGAKLYVADPSDTKRAALERQFDHPVDKVVIKTFSTQDGSSLPQIVRESRSLDAAKRMGLILEHDLTPDRFFYVMRYVPGESLGVITQRLHGLGDSDGLAQRELGEALRYGCDLIDTLRRYHEGGLWHKDVKPDNIIIDSTGAHLVDFGLITPLRSAMTLTTHGTEYFRDPEMVRMALRGAKVHEVDGTKFDIYAAGAVLYSLIENSFPAHGGLSQISKRCPESLRWVIRRAMTDYDKRYESASEMLHDLRAIAIASDPFEVRPAQLPSMGGQPVPEAPAAPAPVMPPPIPQAAPSPAPGAPVPPTPEAGPVRQKPNIKVTGWFTGRYEADGSEPVRTPARQTAIPRVVQAAHASPNDAGRRAHAPAAQQVANARQRAKERRDRAHQRMKSKRSSNHASGINFGVGLAVISFLGLIVTGALLAIGNSDKIHQALTDGPSRPSEPTPPAGWTRDVVWHDGLSRQVFDRWGSYRLVFAPAAPADGLMRHPTDANGVILLTDPIIDEPGVRDRAEAHVDSLRARGLHVVSSGGGDHAQQLVASLRLALQLEPIGSDDATDAIRSWLGEHPEFGMAIWVGRSDEPNVPAHMIVGADGLDGAVYDAALNAFSSQHIADAPMMPPPPPAPAGHGILLTNDGVRVQVVSETVACPEVRVCESECTTTYASCETSVEATCSSPCGR